MIERAEIISKLINGLKPMEYVNALWEGGAAAFNRVDEWSDIDLQLEVKDGHAEEAFAKIEEILNSISPIVHKYRLPDPTWTGNPQAFYRLKGSSPYLLIDVVVLEESSKKMFLEKEIHGEMVFHIDKVGLATQGSYDEAKQKEKMNKKITETKAKFETFKLFPLKEYRRGNFVEAKFAYLAYVLSPLVMLLRIKYGPPEHFNFHTRYIHYELPKDIMKRFEVLHFYSTAEEMMEKYDEGVKWVEELIREYKS